MIKNKIFSLAIFASLSLFSTLSFASDNSPHPHGGRNNQALETAMKECSTTTAKDSQGRPDRTAFENCMTSKGFKKPEGHPGGNHQGEMKNQGEKNSTLNFK